MNLIYLTTTDNRDCILFNGMKYYRGGGKSDHYFISDKLRPPRHSLHHAIYEYFIGPIPDGYVVHHIDGNPENNCVLNLKLMEHGEHSRFHNTGKKNVTFGTHLSDSHKRAISNANRGRHPSNETLKKLSLAATNISDATRMKMRMAKLGKPSPKRGKHYPRRNDDV